MCNQPVDQDRKPSGGGEWVWSESGISPPSNVTVWPQDTNPEVGRLFGPDGNLAKVVRVRPDHPIGFRPDHQAQTVGSYTGQSMAQARWQPPARGAK